MAALLQLHLTRWEAQAVMLPEGPGTRITVFGDWFPLRAVEPEIFVGDLSADRVQVARNLKSIHGYLRRTPKDGVRILVRYGDSQEGVLEEPFAASRIRPLPKDCR